jgi:hypothetical protein
MRNACNIMPGSPENCGKIDIKRDVTEVAIFGKGQAFVNTTRNFQLPLKAIERVAVFKINRNPPTPTPNTLSCPAANCSHCG